MVVETYLRQQHVSGDYILVNDNIKVASSNLDATVEELTLQHNELRKSSVVAPLEPIKRTHFIAMSEFTNSADQSEYLLEIRTRSSDLIQIYSVQRESLLYIAAILTGLGLFLKFFFGMCLDRYTENEFYDQAVEAMFACQDDQIVQKSKDNLDKEEKDAWAKYRGISAIDGGDEKLREAALDRLH